VPHLRNLPARAGDRWLGWSALGTGCYLPGSQRSTETGPIAYNIAMIRKATIIALVLAALGTGTLGIASHQRAWHWEHYRWPLADDQWDESFRARGIVLDADRGKLGAEYRTFFRPPCLPRGKSTWQKFGFILEYQVYSFYLTSPGAGGTPFVCCRYVHIGAPSWAPVILLAFYPILAFIRGPLRRWRRRRKNLCVTCAYDLTGNVSGVCPECATSIPASKGQVKNNQAES
jgi:hypothetical protein